MLHAAEDLGVQIANSGIRLVYGGGGVGLMGACARGAKHAGGEILGVIPHFLTGIEAPPEGVLTIVVNSMHERKMRMFEESDGFAVLPGAIGTLEEVIELLSWRRLALHAKPIVFYNPAGFWNSLFSLFEKFIDSNLLPNEFNQYWKSVDETSTILPTLSGLVSSAGTNTKIIGLT